MKVVFTEAPATKDRDMSIEFSVLPKDAETAIAVFDEHSEHNEQFYKDIADADVVICLPRQERDRRHAQVQGHLLPVHRLQ